MNRDSLIRQIWAEKRGKIVSQTIHPLGIYITIDRQRFTWSDIVNGILQLLIKEPERGYVWSQNWGRTIISLHPNFGLDFRFSLKDNEIEKRGVFIETLPMIDPKHLLDQSTQTGAYKILLNYRPKMSLEGAILQVERMVDELVWCLHLKLLETHDAIEAYQTAAQEILRRGVNLIYTSEDAILENRKKDPQMPVRIYGNVLKTDHVPQVIGAVHLTPLESDYITQNSDEVHDWSKPVIDDFLQTTHTGQSKFYVTSAVTVCKQLHVGHLLNLTFADLVRTAVNAEALYLELNDTGDRIFGTVARLAEVRGVDINNAHHLILNDQVASIELEHAYRTRHTDGELFEQAATLIGRGSADLLAAVTQKIVSSLTMLGLEDIRPIQDSSCVLNVEDLVRSGQIHEDGCGFSFTRFQKASKNVLVVLEKGGILTATATRVAFVLEAQKTRPSQTPIFVDGDPTITRALDLVELTTSIRPIQIEGAGIGFGLKIASGTKGDSISVEDLGRFYRKRFPESSDGDLLSTAKFFLLTRFATVPSHRRSPGTLAKAAPLGLSFYDYRDTDSFVSDFLKAKDEKVEWFNRIRRCLDCLKNDESKLSQIQSELEDIPPAYKAAWLRAKSLPDIQDIKRLLPSPFVLPVMGVMGRIREWIHRRSEIKSPSEIDSAILDEYLSGSRTLGDLARGLKARGIIRVAIPGDSEQEVDFLFLDNLAQRGYSLDEIRRLAPHYLSGSQSLVRKNCYYFDVLNGILELLDAVQHPQRQYRQTLLEAIHLCLNRLGIAKEVLNGVD
ncbi:MAG: hypothetical protein V1846_01340 [Candidatus Komeilibacteria bacterium]